MVCVEYEQEDRLTGFDNVYMRINPAGSPGDSPVSSGRPLFKVSSDTVEGFLIDNQLSVYCRAKGRKNVKSTKKI